MDTVRAVSASTRNPQAHRGQRVGAMITDDEILRKWDACGRPVKWLGPIVSPLWVVPFARAIEERARREEREAAEQDAKRYRWLRAEDALPNGRAAIAVSIGVVSDQDGNVDWTHVEALDCVIDAAMTTDSAAATQTPD